MKDTNRETLSAILDGEGSEFEVRRTLANLQADDATSFGRWQLARDVIRGQSVTPVPQGFSSGLLAAIADEKQDSGSSKGMLLARVAVVATVAFSTLIGIQYWVGPEQQVDHFTTLSAPEQRLGDFAGEVSPVSKSLIDVEQVSVATVDDVSALPDSQAVEDESAGQILE